MTIEQQLIRKVSAAAWVEPVGLLPANPSYFQKILAETVTWKLGEDDLSPLAFPAASREIFNRLSPLVDFLTQPRSITEFQDLKRGLLEIFWQYDFHLREKRQEVFKEGEVGIGEIVGWLYYLLDDLRIFPDMELESISCGQKPQEIWEAYEERGPRPFRSTKEKIITLKQAVALAKQAHEEEEKAARIGYAIGKWRLGPHAEHIELFENA